MSQLHSWSIYIIQKGFALSCLLLVSALILSVWADSTPMFFPLLRRFSLYQNTSASIVLAASLIGGLLLEDCLRKTQ